MEVITITLFIARYFHSSCLGTQEGIWNMRQLYVNNLPHSYYSIKSCKWTKPGLNPGHQAQRADSIPLD